MVHVYAANSPQSIRLPGAPSDSQPLNQKNILIKDPHARQIRLQTALVSHIKSEKKSDSEIVKSKRVTRKQYPIIVELKTAGRSDQEIAKKFGVDPYAMKVHITRAMLEFKQGKVKPDSGKAVDEARKKGGDKAEKFQQDLQGDGSALSIQSGGYDFSGSTASPAMQLVA